MPKISKNTRKHRRIKSCLLIKYQSGTKSGQEQLTNVHDISAGGLRFQTSLPLENGASIRLAVLIPSFEKPIEAEAKVVWVGRGKRKNMPYSVAVEFTKIPEDAKEGLESFIQNLVKEKKSPLFIDLPQFSIRKSERSK
ncbi:MAG TPA: PilZ domain-containing protein [Candidatus Omnitrophota bacterium]|nr:PilZ domain-containing protein [Candidatus Omnitrophota bacterium]